MVLMIGHRGAKGYVQENTFLGFNFALDLNVDGIELDIRISRDNKLVIYHDQTIMTKNKTTKLIESLYYDELVQYGIMGFDNFLSFYKNKCKIFIDI